MKTLGYMPWGSKTSITPFDALFKKSKNVKTHGMDGIDALILWGGEDIDPALYKEKPNYRNEYIQGNSRDLSEWKALQAAKAQNIPIIGVCRGAQMLCAFAGGKLAQHVDGHAGGSHWITAVNPKRATREERMECVSAHHQMMWPGKDVPHELLAVSEENLSKTYHGGPDEFYVCDYEPEVIWFPTVQGLAIQSHPEWMDSRSDFVQYVLELVEDYVLEDSLEVLA